MIRSLPVFLAVTSLTLLSGCEADDSAPKLPRTGTLLTPDQKAQENAERRALEKPGRQLPTGGSEFPGQSALPTADSSIVTLDVTATPPTPTVAQPELHPTNPDFPIRGFTGPSGKAAWGHTTGPKTVYTRDTYPGYLPHLPPNPGTVAMTGSTPAPDGDFAIDHSWGQGLTLTDAPHRDWPTTTATYKTANVLHNPTYYFNIQEHIDVAQYDGTRCGDAKSAFYEVPWFYLNTAALPILMALEPPFAVRLTAFPSQNPVFNGYISPTGPIVPAPYAGRLQWTYPFLNPDYTVIPSASRPTPSTP